MIYHTITLSDLVNSYYTGGSSLPGRHLNILINDSAIIDSKVINILNNIDGSFLVTINVNNESWQGENTLSLLYIITMLHSYAKINEKKTIGLLADKLQIDDHPFINKFKSFFGNQGDSFHWFLYSFDESSYLNIKDDIGFIGNGIYESEVLQNKLFDFLMTNNDCISLLLIQGGQAPPKKLSNKIDAFIGLRTQYIFMKNESWLWAKRTELYMDFLAISKKVQQKEYTDLLDWYNKEYEVLPIWYKRIGHAIKVIMGKRTFRSLFSDKVKKYKN
jgi:hypothetical protein